MAFLVSEERGGRAPEVVEGERDALHAFVAELPERGDRETRQLGQSGLLLDEEDADSARLRADEQHHEPRPEPVGDPELLAREHIVVAGALGARADGAQV